MLTDQQINTILLRVQSGAGLEQAIRTMGLDSNRALAELKARPGFKEQYRQAKAEASL